MNLVQKLINLEPARWLEILQEDLKVIVVRDGDLVSLKYNQIESDMNNPIVCQCRGMVVDTSTNKVVAWPYDKFWNLGESRAVEIDWSTARALEKLDGSLMILYWHDEQWKVASSGHPTAGGSFGSADDTFCEAFWDVWQKSEMEMPPEHYQGTTFMFELCARENRVVVRHEHPKLVLHGARGLDGIEYSLDKLLVIGTCYGWEVVDDEPITTPEECLAWVDKLDPIQHEGMVVVDANFNRVKIKSPRYVILHHMKGEATPRRAIQLWQTGEAGELLTHFPEMTDAIIPVHETLDRIAETAHRDFQEHRGLLPDRKAFALAIKNKPWSSVIFNLLRHDEPTLEVVKSVMRAQNLASLERLVLS